MKTTLILMTLLFVLVLTGCTVLDEKQEKLMSDNWGAFKNTPEDSLLYIYDQCGIKLKKEKPVLADGRLTQYYSVRFKNTNNGSIQTVVYAISNGRVSDISISESNDKVLFFFPQYDNIDNLSAPIRPLAWVFFHGLELLVVLAITSVTIQLVLFLSAIIIFLISILTRKKKSFKSILWNIFKPIYGTKS